VRYDAILRLIIKRPWGGHKESVLKIAQETSSLRECRRIIQSGRNILYQLEVKRWLVAHSFPVAEGWNVTVDIDSMERGVAGQHPPDKKAVASECENWLRNHGVKIDAHPVYGRADLVASKEGVGTFVVEVEGDSSRQKEQAMYSALGQIVLSMDGISQAITYCLAVPDSVQWETQLNKIPKRVRDLLNLDLFLVSKTGVRQVERHGKSDPIHRL
jgi:hypothetical protein